MVACVLYVARCMPYVELLHAELLHCCIVARGMVASLCCARCRMVENNVISVSAIGTSEPLDPLGFSFRSSPKAFRVIINVRTAGSPCVRPATHSALFTPPRSSARSSPSVRAPRAARAGV